MVVHADVFDFADATRGSHGSNAGKQEGVNDFACAALRPDGLLSSSPDEYVPLDATRGSQRRRLWWENKSNPTRLGRDFDCMEWLKPERSLEQTFDEKHR